MGKTSQPLVIWIATEWLEHEKIRELQEKGHQIRTFDGMLTEPPDLILHKNAWRFDDGKWDFLDVVIREARKGQPKRVKRDDAKAGAKPRRSKRSKGSAGE